MENIVPNMRSVGKMANAVLSRGVGRKGELRVVDAEEGLLDMVALGGAVETPRRVVAIWRLYVSFNESFNCKK